MTTYCFNWKKIGLLNEIMTENMTTVVSEEDAKLHQQQYAQLLHRLSKSGAYKVTERIEYLVSEENAEDGGDIPTVASIASFTTFFSNNRDLDEPFLGTTVNGELQAVWELPGHRRLVAEFLADDTMRCLYRRAGDTGSAIAFCEDVNIGMNALPGISESS